MSRSGSSSGILSSPLTIIILRATTRSGQPRFRSMWERYCRGVSAIVFVVDSAIPRPPTSSAPSTKAETANSVDSLTSNKAEQQASSPAQQTSDSPAQAPIDPSADRSTRQANLTTAAGSGSASSRLANIAWHTATEELHALVSRPELSGIPLLVLATKNDVKGAASVEEVIRVM